MKTMQRVGFVVVGVVLGALATSSLGAERRSQDPKPARITFTRVDNDTDGRYTVHLVKSDKRNGCWLMVSPAVINAPVSLAPAPPEICR
jgi:hypothetical protein